MLLVVVVEENIRFLLVDCVCPKTDVHFKLKMSFISAILKRTHRRDWPVTSDVFHCVRVPLIRQGCSFKMQKTRNFAKRY